MFCRIGNDALPSRSPGDALGERLRRLPQFAPPVDGWTRLERRMARPQRYIRYAGGGLALAASILMAVILVPTGPAPEPVPVTTASATAAQATGSTAQLIKVSQQLERRLGALRPRVAVWGSAQAREVREFERGLELIDLQLNYADPQTAERLWRERVALMSALVELHQQPSSRFQYASYQY